MNKKIITESVDYIKSLTDLKPEIAIVLGSGLGDLVDIVTDAISIPYQEIPNFKAPSVSGHGGRLVVGQLGGKVVAVMQGRIHLYEGHPIENVVLAVRVMALWGVKKLLLTNAAGGINATFKAGDLMIIRDHINLQANNPLIGPNEDTLGTRFPDMTHAYDPELSDKIMQVAQAQQLNIKSGVYLATLGPSFETPAEVRMMGILGADAVGMSTVAESIAANHCGVKVVGISLITNLAAGISKTKLTHAEVKATGNQAKDYFAKLVVSFIEQL